MLSARRGLLNARGIRTGYTHWLGLELFREVRFFIGFVSKEAINNNSNVGLVLKHFLRIQTELTKLIRRHLSEGENEKEFVEEVKRLE